MSNSNHMKFHIKYITVGQQSKIFTKDSVFSLVAMNYRLF